LPYALCNQWLAIIRRLNDFFMYRLVALYS